VLKRIPDGTRIHSGKSKTLEDIGLFDTLMGSDGAARWSNSVLLRT
jgi:hypothetical protein